MSSSDSFGYQTLKFEYYTTPRWASHNLTQACHRLTVLSQIDPLPEHGDGIESAHILFYSSNH